MVNSRTKSHARWRSSYQATTTLKRFKIKLQKLNIKLLGNFRVHAESGCDVVIPGKKKIGLLAYLVLSPNHSMSRDRAITLFWRQRDLEKQAKPSLRTALSELKKILAAANVVNLIDSDRQSIWLNADAFISDTLELKRLSCSPLIQEKTRALDLYRQELLSGVEFGEQDFADWLHNERVQYRELFREILRDLLHHALETDELDQAIQFANRMLLLDSADEEAHRGLMSAHSSQGNQPLALKQYQQCRDVLLSEFQVQPSTATVELAREIKSGDRGRAAQDSNKIVISKVVLRAGEHLSLGVTPFLSTVLDDPSDDLGDDLAEDIIGALSRFKWLSVAPRSATFSFGKNDVDAITIGQTLGLRYIVDGSIRRGGGKARIKVELISVDAARVIGSQTCRCTLAQDFSIPSETVAGIVAQLDAWIRSAGVSKVVSKTMSSMDAQDHLMTAIANMREMTRDSFDQARKSFAQAEQLDPDSAVIYSWRAFREIFYFGQSWNQPKDEHRIIKELAQKAIALDPQDAMAYAMLGHYNSFYERDFDEGKRNFERALLENPNSAFCWMFSAATFCYCGEYQEALDRLDHSKRLCPIEPHYEFVFNSSKCQAHTFARQYREAASWGRKLVRETPNFANGIKQLLVPLGHLGEKQEAKEYLRRLLEIEPGFTLSAYRDRRPFKNSEDREEFVQGLVKAGVPEEADPGYKAQTLESARVV